MIPEAVAQRYRASGAWGEQTLPQRLNEIVAGMGPATALMDGNVRVDFADAARLVRRLAAHLAALGTRPGDVVSWQLPNRWEAAIVHHAAIRAGAISNPLNPGFRERELRFVLAEADPAVLVVAGEHRGFDHAALGRELRAAGLARRLVVSRGEGETTLEHLLETEPSADEPPMPTDPAALALLLYTSGTTGDPKGVLHTHRSLLCELDSFVRIHGLTPSDRYLGGAPVGHIAGCVYGLCAPFALGTSTTLLERWDPETALEAIERDRVTFQTGPPTFLQTLAEHPHAAEHDLSSFRLFSTGGASISTAQIRRAADRIGCVVKRAYGSTEVPTLTATTLDDDETSRTESDGALIGEAEMRIVAPDGSDAAPGEQGEIWARAPEMFVGYRSGADAFEPGGWFRTGDLATVDGRGLLHVTGRIKDIIIRGGENISAKEIEDLLCEHPAVREAALVGLPDEVLGERACAFVTLRDGSAFGFDEMTAHLRDRAVARHKFPERLEVVASLPRTESGKVRKDELRRSVTN